MCVWFFELKSFFLSLENFVVFVIFIDGYFIGGYIDSVLWFQFGLRDFVMKNFG